MKVLLIEDDEAISQSLQMLFTSENIECEVVAYGEKGLEIGSFYNANYDIVLLDIMLPDISGFDILTKLRSTKVKIPVLILSGMADVESRIRGLGLGADDYMIKPFHRGELLARMNAIIRRSQGYAHSVLKFDKITLDLDNRTVFVDKKPIPLTAKEYAILELLAMNVGSMVTRQTIFNHLYDGSYEFKGKIVNVFMCKLRNKLYEASGGRNYIDTAWGCGYLLRKPAEVKEKLLS